MYPSFAKYSSGLCFFQILQQQRLAQAQQRAQEAPHDPSAWIEALPPSLRQNILSEMDDTEIAALPEALQAEARRLRQQMEQQMAQRYANAAFRQFPFYMGRPSGRAYRPGTAGRGGRQPIQAFFPFGSGPGSRFATARTELGAPTSIGPMGRHKGQQLLDREALSCLLTLFFLDDQKLNTIRLQRIVKCLCAHGPTRDWIIRAFLSILEKTRTCAESVVPLVEQTNEAAGSVTTRAQAKVKSIGTNLISCDTKVPTQNWLNVTLGGAMGQRTNVFTITRPPGSAKKQHSHGHHTASTSVGATVAIHPQAAVSVCRHVLDAVIPLAKSFPDHFSPAVVGEEKPKCSKDETEKSSVPLSTSDFWDILVRLDSTGPGSTGTSKKGGKGLVRTHTISSAVTDEFKYDSLEEAPVGYLMTMLNHPILAKNSQLMDRLVRLLSLISTHISAAPMQSGGEKLSEVGRTEIGNTPLLKTQLALAVDVLTNGLCTDEGLEDLRSFLLQLVRSFGDSIYETLLNLLLESAMKLGFRLASEISVLMEELRDLNANRLRDTEAPSTSSNQKGVIQDRFSKGESVVITASTTKKTGLMANSKELQLPSMAKLTHKNATQNVLFRNLNTIIQLREARKHSEAKSVEKSVENRTVTEGNTVVGNVQVGTAAATPMEVDQSGNESQITVAAEENSGPQRLSQLLTLDSLWTALSHCLDELSEAADPHAVLVLQPAVESFFLVHASTREPIEPASAAMQSQLSESRERTESGGDLLASASPGLLLDQSVMSASIPPDSSFYNLASTYQNLSTDLQKFLKFAEQHRKVLNQILRQSQGHLSDGPFAVLVDHTRLLDFDIKRKYYRRELERLDDTSRRDDIAIRVRRDQVFQDSYRELHRLRVNDWKGRFYVVFEGEEGQDAGGLLREWFSIITREIFNPNYALFMTSPGDRVTYMINPSSYINREHLDYFKFVGRIIAKACYDNKLLDCFFTRAFYKHILGKPVRYHDLESEDPSFYQSLCFVLENPVEDLGYDLTFSLEVTDIVCRVSR